MWWACVGGGAVLMGLVAVKKDKALTILGTSMLGSMMVRYVKRHWCLRRRARHSFVSKNS
eukprot:COSAG01_NODE_4189_length_5250_cov_12.234735_2_plen_60_part_00